MAIGWNEIRRRAVAFSKEWAGEAKENAEAQTFWNEFFDVFGVRRRTVANFQEPVKKLSGKWGFIDLFWKGMALVEHKSLGKSLTAAESQASDYVTALKNEGREDDIPQYIVVSDFARIAIHDLAANTSVEFGLDELDENVQAFGFMAGYTQYALAEEDPANFEAVEKMGRLHDALEDGGYKGARLERFLVRILFCLFAEDTSIFDPNAFTQFIEEKTEEDGSDLGAQLAHMFDVLNTEEGERSKNLDDLLAALPYVNGDLFKDNLGFADFTKPMRDALISCCRFRWAKISPAIFGSLFQSIMEDRERRQIGGHYTSEEKLKGTGINTAIPRATAALKS